VSLPLASLALFGAGVAGSLSPCVLPLAPGMLAVIVDGVAGGARTWRVAQFSLAAAFTFAALGSVAAAAGVATIASVTAERVAGVVLLVLAGLALAAEHGWWSPTWRWTPGLRTGSRWRPIALGVGCGAAWTPCVGPMLGAALTAAATSGSIGRGGWLLFVFGVGVTTPYLTLAFVPVTRVPQWWRRVGVVAQRVAPWMLLVMGMLLVSGRYSAVVQRLVSGT
jgi:cytochrome c-type biogenesis protein